MIGADTTFLIDFFKGESHAVEWMKQNQEFLCLCEPVVYEFLCGNLTEHQQDVFLAFISQFPVFSFNRQAALRSSQLYRGVKRKGQAVAHPDAIIAGTYAANEVATIVTRNNKHFENVIGTIEY
ncbi:MAG TPA: type II toxin-antitoxin system VapC family toxin [Candidatus Nanoarchaeia archaeon]|nr:type II toxin-antitoxin system VapC family toxin [Candidatus Nanoarchaeia archaeon]